MWVFVCLSCSDKVLSSEAVCHAALSHHHVDCPWGRDFVGFLQPLTRLVGAA
jgi:hypothetical protein